MLRAFSEYDSVTTRSPPTSPLEKGEGCSNSKHHPIARVVFFLLSLEVLTLLSHLSSCDDMDVAVLLWIAGLLALAGWLSPHGLGALETSSLATFSSSVWMVYRVHCRTANGWADTEPAVATCLAFVAELVLTIGYFSDRCPRSLRDFADLGGWHLEKDIAHVIGDQLDVVPCRSADLCTSASLELDVVDVGTDRDLGKWESVARLEWGLLAIDDCVSDLEGLWRENVSSLSVMVADERDESGAKWVVFDGLDLGWDIELIVFEVDKTIHRFVSPSTVAHGDAPLVVATHRRLASLCQLLVWLLGRQDIAVGDELGISATWGCWLKCFHRCVDGEWSLGLYELDRISLLEIDHRLLTAWGFHDPT